MSKTVLFQAIQFSISTQFSSIRTIDRILSVATTSGQSGPRSDCYILIIITTQRRRKMSKDFLRKYNSHFIVRVRKGLFNVFCRPFLWPSVLCLSRSLDAQPEARGPLCWLSLLHLISNFSGPQLTRGPRGPLRPGVAFPTTSQLRLQLSDFLSWLSYIIVQRPLNRPLNPWNGIFDRHQAEIIVTLFRGISLWVYHEIFSLSHFVSQVQLGDFSS